MVTYHFTPPRSVFVMKRKILKRIRLAQASAEAHLTTITPQGSGLGVPLRTLLKHANWRQAIGVNLAGLAFFAGIVIPQTQEAISSLEVTMDTKETVIVVDATPSTYQWPLGIFGISQGFTYYHPGMDLTDPIGTPVYPIREGTVTWVEFLPYGYGHHVLVTHKDGIKSLYAHLSNVFVKNGDQILKNTVLGQVGITGKTTGSHLHLEIYQNDVPTNPLEVLPDIR